MLFGNYFQDSIYIAAEHDVLKHLEQGYHGATGVSLIFSAMLHGIQTPPFWLALAGILFAWLCYIKQPDLPGRIAATFAPITRALENKYWMDEFNQAVFANGAVALGKRLWKSVDAGLIDGVIVNGSANLVAAVAGKLRTIQSGYIYHYAFAMIIGLVLLIAFAIWF